MIQNQSLLDVLHGFLEKKIKSMIIEFILKKKNERNLKIPFVL